MRCAGVVLGKGEKFAGVLTTAKISRATCCDGKPHSVQGRAPHPD